MPDSAVDELWLHWKEHADVEARDRLILHYSPLVKFVVGRLRAGMPASVEQADLVSEGVIGLMDAMDRFEIRRGIQFQTFAVPRIRGAIVDALRAADWVPRSRRDQFRAYDRAAEVLEHRLGRSPTEDDVALELGVSPAAVRRIVDERAQTRTVNLKAHDEAENDSLQVLESPSVDGGDLPAGFSEAVLSLPERDQIVMALYYWEGLTLAEIGRVLGVGESRVSQLHTRATATLRKGFSDIR